MHDDNTPRGAPLTNLARLRFRLIEALRTLESIEPEVSQPIHDDLFEDLTGALHLLSIVEDETAAAAFGRPRKVLPFVRAKGVQ